MRRSIFGSKLKVAFAATALGLGVGGAKIASSDDPATALKLCTTVPPSPLLPLLLVHLLFVNCYYCCLIISISLYNSPLEAVELLNRAR